MAIELIAELATAHGGDVNLACDMVRAAADAGAHTVKIQSYTLTHLNPKDPQHDWLKQSCLDEKAHERIIHACQDAKVGFLSTPFDLDALKMLLNRLGVRRLKLASSQPLWGDDSVEIIKSWPWGQHPDYALNKRAGIVQPVALTAIPLYPTPIEAVAAVPLLDGWSDHTIGTAVCKHMISKGAQTIEAHFCLPGESRQMSWDKTPEQLRDIRDWADMVETMQTGVTQRFREMWRA